MTVPAMLHHITVGKHYSYMSRYPKSYNCCWVLFVLFLLSASVDAIMVLIVVGWFVGRVSE